MSSESHARNMAVESPRFPGEGSSAQGKSGPKVRTSASRVMVNPVGERGCVVVKYATL